MPSGQRRRTSECSGIDLAQVDDVREVRGAGAHLDPQLVHADACVHPLQGVGGDHFLARKGVGRGSVEEGTISLNSKLPDAVCARARVPLKELDVARGEILRN